MENKDYFVERFYCEHKLYYEFALREIKNEKKVSHWIWFIFPQLKALGSSPKALLYGIENAEEARLYYNDAYLGEKFREICQALLECKSDNPYIIMGDPDYLKLRSSMTLFYISTGDELFKKVLDKFYGGVPDDVTVRLLNLEEKHN